MTRCLNCGADREKDLCAACGLNSSAAEFALRRKVLNRTAIFLVGTLAFVAASVHYPTLEIDGMLIFIGVLFALTLGLAIWVERRAVGHAEVEKLKRVYYALIPVPWLLAVLLLANGALDRGTTQRVEAKVVGKFAMRGPVPTRRIIVTSWRPGHRWERVAVANDDFDRVQVGEWVEIEVHEGLAGIPWVGGVSSRE
jgi:hypothetical protein